MDGLQGADAFDARLESLRDGTATKVVLGRFGLLAVQRAQERVHRRTGNLARTIRVAEVDVREQRVRVTAGGTGRRGANQYGTYASGSVGYAAVEELGRRPVTIVPRRKKVLAWGGARRLSGSLRKGAKATNFARIVRQPARQGHPYLRPGAEQALREVGLADAVISVWNAAA